MPKFSSNESSSPGGGVFVPVPLLALARAVNAAEGQYAESLIDDEGGGTNLRALR